MNYFQRRKILKGISATELIPVRKVLHTVEDGRVVLQIPKFENSFINLLLPATRSMYFHVKLDDHGTKVWEAMDGYHTIGEIAELIRDSLVSEENSDDLFERLSKFTSRLYENKYITFRQLITKNTKL